jgi:NAD(P)-dependent dehydrogenase (short-subunit alcohol dehydrogenase family)
VQLKETVALVTGGAGGLGEATVRQLAAAGASVIIADVADDRAAALAKDIGAPARYLRTDVTDEQSVNQAIRAAQELGPLRVTVCTHGGPAVGGRIVSKDGVPQSLEGFRGTIEHYLTGTYNVMRLAGAAMVKSDPDEDGNRGVIVNTASIAAFEGQIGQVAYSAAKGGVVAMTLVAARDLSPSGVRVVSIAPGTFFTPAFRLSEEDAQSRWGNNVPFPNRMGRPAEYGALVQHICENDYLNGETIRLDAALRMPPK